eukprot:10272-Lingulodinium_polyedra.AAC.1
MARRGGRGETPAVAQPLLHPRPGAVVAVSYADDPGWTHDRVLGYPVEEGRWIVLTADGDEYDERLEDWQSAFDMTG